MSLVMRAAAATDAGPVRPNNEDSAFAGRKLVAVADGIGGLPDGEQASEHRDRCARPPGDLPRSPTRDDRA